MFEKLSFIEQQHEELTAKISDPEVMADMDNWRKLCKEHSDMTPIVEKYKEYKANKNTIDDAKMMLDDPETDREFKDMLQAIEDKQVNAEFVYAGDEFELGSAYITVVWPEIGFSDSNLNNWSAVLLVEYQGVSILLTGDSEKKVEDDYLKYIPGEIDILKVAHHGSDTSSGAKLLEAIDPDYAVLSLGAGNDYNHPHKEPMERLENCGAEIYRTDRSGNITFTVKEGEISVATER